MYENWTDEAEYNQKLTKYRFGLLLELQNRWTPMMDTNVSNVNVNVQTANRSKNGYVDVTFHSFI